jgi:hypothetical protein
VDDPRISSFEFPVAIFRRGEWPIVNQGITQPQPSNLPAAVKERDPDALYQGQRVVARVLNPEIHAGEKVIRFDEVCHSDELLLPDECEFQKYRILIQRIAYASKVNKEEPHKGRILRGVTAEILGYREQ